MMRAGSAVRRSFTRSTGGGGGLALDLNLMTGTLPSIVTFSRASAATDSFYTDAAGSSFNNYLSGAPRMLATGYLAEEARTNSLLNSAAAVTQTTASLGTGTYVFWCIGTGSVTSSAGTATASGLGAITGSQGTFQTIVVTVAGTLTFTVSGSINRFQLELGSFPTSFISTAGVAATRSADSATVALSATVIPTNPAALTIVSKFTSPAVLITSKNYTVVEVDDGTSNNRTVLRFSAVSGNTLQAITVSGGSAQFSLNAYTSPPAATVMRTWMAIASAATAVQAIGQTKLTSAAATALAAGQTTIRIGISNVATEALNAPLARLQFYNTRLPDAQAAAIAASL